MTSNFVALFRAEPIQTIIFRIEVGFRVGVAGGEGLAGFIASPRVIEIFEATTGFLRAVRPGSANDLRRSRCIMIVTQYGRRAAVEVHGKY